MSRVYLHKGHGVNPSVFQCFFCGEDIGIIMPGAKVHDFQRAGLADASGQMNMSCGAIDYEPCEKCRLVMEQGIIFISTRDDDKDYRTGGWCALKENAVRRMSIDPRMLEDICERRACFIQDTVYDGLGLPRDVEINNME